MGASYRIQFTLTREQYEQYAIKYPNANANVICKQIFLDMVSGKLELGKARNVKEEIEQQRLKNLRQDGAIKTLTVWKMSKENRLPMTLDDLIAITNGKKDAQQLIFASMDTNEKQSQPKPEPKTPVWVKEFNRLTCWDCDPRHSFQYQEGDKADMIKQSELFVEHITKIHGRPLNQLEKDSLMIFLNEVDKIAA